MGLDRGEGIGLGLVIVGLLLLLVVFYAGYTAYKSTNLQVNVNGSNAVQVLGVSAQVLINLLVKLAFLGISLAAGSIIISKGVDLLKKCPKQEV